MSAAERPWWASDDAAPDADDGDPVTAHRRARRGAGDRPGGDVDEDWWTRAADAVGRVPHDLGGAGAGPAADADEDRPHRVDACGVCPVCVGLRVLGDARPELVGHLAEAARQLALAVRTVVDAAVDAGQAAAADEDDRLQRIDLDD